MKILNKITEAIRTNISLVKFICLVTTTMFCLTATSQIPSPGFSGNWALNISKSDFGGQNADQTAAKSVTIGTQNQFVTLTRIFAGNPATIETYKSDGSTPDTTIAGIYHKSSSLKWSDDKSGFKILSKYHVTPEGKDPYDYTRTEAYALSNDGTLTITRITVLPDVTQTSKAVYDKQ